MPVIPNPPSIDGLIAKCLQYGVEHEEYARLKIAEWWNANNTNEMITGAYSGLSWDELPEWAQESAAKLYRSCRR